MKYAESFPATATPVKPRLLEVAELSGTYVDASRPELHRPPLRQFFAEHNLCYAMVHERRDFDRGRFVLIAPTMNHEMATVVQAYRGHLATSAPEAIPFDVVSLERLVAAMADCGQAEVARSLDERYLDFGPVYNLIDDWTPHAAAQQPPGRAEVPLHSQQHVLHRAGLSVPLAG